MGRYPGTVSLEPGPGQLALIAVAAEETHLRQVLIVSTELGEFSITIASRQAPHTCEYFCGLAATHALDNSKIFRIIAPVNHSNKDNHPIAALQLGLIDGLYAARTTIPHESTDQSRLTHNKWTVSASRFAPGEVYGSFFICMREEPVLDHGGPRPEDRLGYAAFGKVTAGHDVLTMIYNHAQPQEILDVPIFVQTVRVRTSTEAICL